MGFWDGLTEDELTRDVLGDAHLQIILEAHPFKKMSFRDGLTGDELARYVLGDAQDPIDCRKDYNYSRHAPLAHRHCNSKGKRLE